MLDSADSCAILLQFVTKMDDFDDNDAIMKCAPFVGRV